MADLIAWLLVIAIAAYACAAAPTTARASGTCWPVVPSAGNGPAG
ncbi:hypothetical protein ACFQ1I_01750 [Kitasatospora arboriphila]